MQICEYYILYTQMLAHIIISYFQNIQCWRRETNPMITGTFQPNGNQKRKNANPSKLYLLNINSGGYTSDLRN